MHEVARGNTAPAHDRVFAKCAWRIIPIMIVVYVTQFIDRVNVGFAALTMNRDLGFSPSVYGFGAGVLFIGVTLFQVPGGVMAERFGVRRWFFCTMMMWGAVSAATAFIRTPQAFYALRFLLGLAEAAFIPGMIFYLTLWFPRAYRARFTASFMLGVPVAFVIGGPLSSFILGLDGTAGLHGWQWLFLLEGLPACILAVVVLIFLPDGPRHARWLTGQQKEFISSSLARESLDGEQKVMAALSDRRVLLLALVFFGQQSGGYAFDFWLPQIVQAMGFSNFATGFVVTLPFAASAVAMVLWGRSSDVTNERIWHVAIPVLLASGAFALASFAPSSALVALTALILARIGFSSFYGPFWALASSILKARGAAGGIAVITCAGNGLGGLVGPSVMGVLKQWSGGYTFAMIALAAGLALTALIVLALGRVIGPRGRVMAAAPSLLSG